MEEPMREPIRHTFGLGTPIMNPDQSEIWAFFAKYGQIDGDTFHFRTVSRLLGTIPEGIDSDLVHVERFTTISFYKGIWTAGYETIQKDFEENDLFIRCPLTGPESVHQALQVLLNDDHFTSYFIEESPHDKDFFRALKHYNQVNLRRRRANCD